MTRRNDPKNGPENDDLPTEDFASMLAEFDKASGPPRQKAFKVGETVRGKIISIGQESVFVDLGAKSEGVLDSAEVLGEDGRLTVKVGDEIEARIVDAGRSSGTIFLRRSVGGRGAGGGDEALAQAAELGIPVEGTVTAVNKGGVEVLVAGVRAFCPISQLDLRHVEDAASFVGQRLEFRITRYEPGPRGRDANIVVSRRALLEIQARKQGEETRAKLEVGAVFKGTITTVKDYGAFVDLGGLEGMLHVSQIGFTRVAHPSEVLAVGQAVEVQVIGIEKTGDPKRPEKISLSLKALAEDPWDDVTTRFYEGIRVRGKVARVEQFGAFVEIAPGIEGLLHISELAAEGAGKRQVRHAREVVKPGEEVEVTVLGVDREKRRISLSMKSRDGEVDEAGGPAVAPAAPATLGTFADLFKKPKSKK